MKQDARVLAKDVTHFAFDSDGCLFSNIVWEGVSLTFGRRRFVIKPKLRSFYDGQGVSLMRELGIRICVITNEKGDNAQGVRATVEKWNSLPSCSEGRWPRVELFEGCGGPRKLLTLEGWLQQSDGVLGRCGAMGDDLVDVPMLRAVRFSAAPASAEEAIKSLCHFVTKRAGGEGAVRDVANFFVEVHGKNPLELPFE